MTIKKLKKRSYLRSSEPATVSFNFQDIADGTGVIVLYLAVSEDNSTKDYHLMQSTSIYSSQIETGGGTYDFDLTAFNSPRTVKGTAYFSIALVQNHAGSNSGVNARLKKYDGSTETNITDTITSINYTAEDIYMVLLEMPCTETNFKVGDILRLSVGVTGSGSSVPKIGTDPAGRAGIEIGVDASSTSRGAIFVPLKLNI